VPFVWCFAVCLSVFFFFFFLVKNKNDVFKQKKKDRLAKNA